jgi:hypothetical protein
VLGWSPGRVRFICRLHGHEWPLKHEGVQNENEGVGAYLGAEDGNSASASGVVCSCLTASWHQHGHLAFKTSLPRQGLAQPLFPTTRISTCKIFYTQPLQIANQTTDTTISPARLSSPGGHFPIRRKTNARTKCGISKVAWTIGN